MSVINSLVAQPNRIIIATEFVNGFGDKGATMDDLEKMLTPISPQQGQVTEGDLETDSGGSSGTTIAAKVLSEMLKLKILERTDNENLRVSPALSGNPQKVEWTTRLHDYLFPILTSLDSAREHGQAELPEALCWLLQQSPTQMLRVTGGGHYNILVSQMVDGDPLNSSIGNDSRYQNLIYWARYLGLAERLELRQVADMVIADPTRAIEIRLPVLFGEERQMTINVFAHRLGTHIPILNGGAVCHEMQGRFKETLQAKDKHLGESISLAMLRLQQSGKIKLEGLSDAAAWELQVGRESKSVSHITYLKSSQS
jgi:hypothetical protein